MCGCDPKHACVCRHISLGEPIYWYVHMCLGVRVCMCSHVPIYVYELDVCVCVCVCTVAVLAHAAVTKCQTNKHIFLTVLEAEQPKIKLPENVVPGEDSGLQMASFLLCPHMGVRTSAQEFLGGYSYLVYNPQ